MYLYTKPTETFIGKRDKVYTAAETKQILHNTNVNTTIAPAKQERFDVNAIGKIIAKNLPASPVVNFDRDYLEVSISNALNKERIFNKKHQFGK
jgi:hypothetical protein